MGFIPTVEHKLITRVYIKHAVKKLVSQELDPSTSFASQRVGAIRVIQNLVSILYCRFFNMLTIC